MLPFTVYPKALHYSNRWQIYEIFPIVPSKKGKICRKHESHPYGNLTACLSPVWR